MSSATVNDAVMDTNENPIILRHLGELDEIATCKCGGVLQSVPMQTPKGVSRDRSQFGMAITHKADGTPIRNLDTKGPVLTIIELGWCGVCEDYSVVLDDTDDAEYWAELPKWERSV